MKDVLISSTISMSDDSFASESLTIECVLSSNEISYSLKSLIDIKAADYSFIDEVIMQIVCDQLQIVETVSKSFNQRDLKLICMYCFLEIVITRH